MRGTYRGRGMECVKTGPTNLELASEIIPRRAPVVRTTPRFQVIVEYTAGVCAPSAVAESPEEAVEAFMVQTPGCEEGEISLFDRDERRVVASVKWKIHGTEIGLPVWGRQNVFYDWHLALIACAILQGKRTGVGADRCSGRSVSPTSRRRSSA